MNEHLIQCMHRKHMGGRIIIRGACIPSQTNICVRYNRESYDDGKCA